MRGRARAPAMAGASWPSRTPALGVLPIGYGDGWRRGLSNNADVLIGGPRYPLVGTVSMDNITVDLGPDAARERCAGQRAILIGFQGSERITAEEVARRLDTINYEVTCALTPRVPRVYHRDGAPLRAAARGGARAGAGWMGEHERRPGGGPQGARGRAGLAGRRGACATALLGRGDGRRRRAWSRRRPRAGRARGRRGGRAGGRASRCPRSSARGGWSPATAPGRSTSSRCAAARSRTTSRCATSRSTRSPSRSRAARRSTRWEASPTCGAGRLRMAGPRRVRRSTRCGCCGSCASRSSSAWSPSARPCAGPRAAGRAGWRDVSAERVFVELRRIVAAPAARSGLGDAGELGATAVVLPELEALRGVEQSRFHHLDVYGHTLEVLERAVELTARRGRRGCLHARRLLGAQLAGGARALLAEPLADEMTRGEALRWGALLHDAAKPLTREVRRADGRVTFIGHDVRGRRARPRGARHACARASACARTWRRWCATTCGWASSSTSPSRWRGTVFAYLRACSPVEVDVTLLSIADRLATRGDGARAGDRRPPALWPEAMLGRRSALARGGPACAAAARRRAGRRSSASRRARAWARCWRRSPRPSMPARSARASRPLALRAARWLERSLGAAD